METPTDRELVLRIRQGELEDYGELVRRYQSSVFNVCYRLLGERRDAEDMTQDTFIRAYQRLHTFDASRPFGPWIRRVAANLTLNHLKRKTTPQVPLDEERDRQYQSPSANPETTYVRREQAAIIREAILSLPPHYRAVIELRHFQDMDYQQMAETLNLPLNTVKSHLFRARKLLAQALSREQGGK